jgi:hypothetical protein
MVSELLDSGVGGTSMNRFRFLLVFVVLLASSGVAYSQDIYGGRSRADDLINACGSKGLRSIFVYDTRVL